MFYSAGFCLVCRLLIKNGNSVDAGVLYDSYEVEYLPNEGLLSSSRFLFIELTTDATGTSTGIAIRYQGEIYKGTSSSFGSHLFLIAAKPLLFWLKFGDNSTFPSGIQFEMALNSSYLPRYICLGAPSSDIGLGSAPRGPLGNTISVICLGFSFIASNGIKSKESRSYVCNRAHYDH